MELIIPSVCAVEPVVESKGNESLQCVDKFCYVGDIIGVYSSMSKLFLHQELGMIVKVQGVNSLIKSERVFPTHEW